MEHICYITPDDIVIGNKSDDIIYHMRQGRATLKRMSSIVSFKVSNIRVMRLGSVNYFRYLLDDNEVNWFSVEYDIRSGIYYTKFESLYYYDNSNLDNLYKEFNREEKLNQLGI